MQDSIPGLRSHDLSQRQLLNQLSHPRRPGLPILFFVQPASVFRSRFLVLITSANPEDCPRHLPQWT